MFFQSQISLANGRLQLTTAGRAEFFQLQAPEFAGFVERFDAYWEKIREAHVSRGEAVLTFDPEFGPPTYLHTLPYTQQPVADLWDICLWMAERTRQKWG